MGAKIQIDHLKGKGWAEVFKSPGMWNVVDQAGERIAAEAGDHFGYVRGAKFDYTAGGFVSSDAYGAYEEATNKVLTKAVHR